MKSYVAKEPKLEDREWVLMDAANQPLGRLAVKIAFVLRGKNKANFTPQVDTGSFVVVVNAEKVKLTGRKEEQKTYHRFSGYRSGLKTIPVAVLRERHPNRLIELAVRGMLPKNKLSRKYLNRLKVYKGSEHPHVAQKPKSVKQA